MRKQVLAFIKMSDFNETARTLDYNNKGETVADPPRVLLVYVHPLLFEYMFIVCSMFEAP